ncbi:MalY/PatB family protein [Streptomyces sp. NBC_00059]|uniref:MalY/PatB family protein n=1 Tax=Streptomyces sp. NBC_00059 TaxID=2975635 RepID=UPI0022519C57|nr:aminotransferase class I/II-fold pyridoxal phosphate-dependent enzyme [Streptomyces sp. NBC_00059]MCX5415770.1 aminotransferase class I/II-fold pyridoxal phosphate-dependent enzyme [Streptomyces sp. NBC_00059]
MDTTEFSALPSLGVEDLACRDGEKWATAGRGVLASWVADMDFPVPDVVREAVARRAGGDLGYPVWFDESRGGPLGEPFAERMWRRHGHAPDPTHVRLFTDVNQALLATLDAATAPGDGVLLHTPACPPFVEAVGRIGRRPLAVPLQEGAHGWEFGLEPLTEAAGRPGGSRVLFLVNPHNPTGRVLRRAELEELAAFVLERDLLVISDEVHADLVHAPHRHVPFASLGPEIAARTITLTSGSKAFNLAGVRCAVAHIGPRAVREAVDAQRGLFYGQVSVLAVEALKAAWTAGDPWLDGVRKVLAGNRDRLLARLPEGVRCHTPEATFLAWLDCRGLGLGTDPMPFFRDEAKVLLFSGPSFGPEGEGFVRLNFGTDPVILEETLDRMDGALRRRPQNS